ncbi:MAG: ATP-dependent DNA ligase [Nanoarchaeota archaeon]
MRYKLLAETYQELSSTAKRLEKTSILSKFLMHLGEKDKDVIYLLLGDIYPEYNEKKIGISSQLAIKSISKSSGASIEKINSEWKKIGDLGKVAELLITKKKQSTLTSHILTTEKVIENLRKLPELEGKGTVDKKISLITELLASAEPIEALYLVRTLLADLRIGLKEATIREAMAHAFFKDNESSSKALQKAIDKSNDLGEVFEMAKKGRIKDLDKILLEVGKPIKVMLAQKTKSIKEGFEAVGKPCAIEYKYDGFRLLIHKKDSKIMLFTRRLENVTKQFPEVVEYVLKFVKGKSFILDSEAVGYHKETKEYTPFQSVSQRIRRKYDIEKMQKELPVEINVFDILFYNGKSFLDEPFEKRTKLIREIINNQPYKIASSKQVITSDEKTAEKFYKKALEDRQEGVMLKNLYSPYNPGSRVGHMLKLKPEDKDLDLIIIGAEYGTGKRSGWMSSFILACRHKNEFLEIGKVSTGLKEKSEGISFEELTKKLLPLITKEKGRIVELKPKVVVSVTYQEIQKSPNYSSGYALRFPRFTALRPDKSSSDTATLEDIRKDFESQKRNYKYG